MALCGTCQHFQPCDVCAFYEECVSDKTVGDHGFGCCMRHQDVDGTAMEGSFRDTWKRQDTKTCHLPIIR